MCGLLFALAASWILSGQGGNPAPPAASLEYQVKAAFLYNFAKFVEWPADKPGGGPFVVGVLGKDPFGAALDQAFGGKTINGRAPQIWRITGVAEARQCQILFVSSSEAKRLPEILGTLRSASVLTVSEIEDFAESGGMIRLRTEENKVRLEINVDAATQAGIRISSKLLALARVVRGEARTAKH
ncbi:MAG TPA: YfiR family protein [Bryobacterales bacterium]|nr:YfiR family protein [Bryobacterales bacterium]